MALSSAFYGSSILFAASDAGVFAALDASGSLDCPGVCEACGLDARGGRLLLDAAVAVGLLVKQEEHYCNAPDVAAHLVPGKPGDMSAAIRYNRDVYDAWGKLPQFAASGAPVERPELHLGEDEARTRDFVLSMHGRALAIGQAVVPQLDLTGCERLLDVGGGPGTYAVLTAQHNPGLKQCTVLDLPGIVRVANELIDAAGMSDRVQTLPGSYHDTPFPAGQDVVHIFGVLHQESAGSIQSLLKRAYAALEPGGRIHIMDMMTDATRTSPPFSALFALNMALSTTHGWVFSDEEIATWMRDAGFEDVSVSPLAPPMPHWLAVGRRPGV
jgi:cyclopropane fatty-acyl-phospholipid synthase-like methyltransferase